jgi:hypothetical protein
VGVETLTSPQQFSALVISQLARQSRGRQFFLHRLGRAVKYIWED